MPAPALPVILPLPAPADAEVPPPNDQPWVVNEVRGPWPRIVANGTWYLLYPERVEGPEKAVAGIHQLYTADIRNCLDAHEAMLLRRGGAPCLVVENVDLEFASLLVRQPDFMVYRRDLGIADKFDLPSRFRVTQHGAPDWVLEVLSPKTWQQDVGHRVPDDENKMRIYAELGITEYWIVNPLPPAIWPGPRLQGFRLDPAAGRYVPIRPDADGRLPSTVLGTFLAVDAEDNVRLWNLETRDWWPANMIGSLEQQLLDKNQQLADKDQQLADKDAENRRLAAEVAALKREQRNGGTRGSPPE